MIAIDPGDTTGVFAGYVQPQTTRVETLKTLSNRKATEVFGAFDDQARELAEIVQRFYAVAQIAGIAADDIAVAIEDFQSRPNSGVVRLTSCWVAAATVVLLPPTIAASVTWQQPSDAKNLATNERLRDWGLWEVGSEHRRDAARHFALRVDRIVQMG